MVLERLFRRQQEDEAVTSLYAQIVAQARRAEFYEVMGVPDSLDGRFDILVLHAFLFFHRLKEEDKPIRDFGQAVFDAMFADMDQNLREMGVSDVVVGKRVKKMASAFYGRATAYDEALVDPSQLETVIRRNIFPEQDVSDTVLRALAQYVTASVEKLSTQEVGAFLSGSLVFAEPPSDLSFEV
jgi:cytochrome b pre-mRNA-processing protein 3